MLRGLVWSAAVVAVADGLIRGLPRSKQTQYSDGVTCVPRDRSGSVTGTVHVPIERINDNYCDCEDGSDEPGTASACENARFYCVNAAHKGAYIPSSHVDDGACDCCDGSDEPDGACPDTCALDGEASRKAAMEEAELIMKGVAARSELHAVGKRLIRDDSEKLEIARAEVIAVEGKIVAAEKRVRILKIIRDDAERLHEPADTPNGGIQENPGLEDSSGIGESVADEEYPNIDTESFDGEVESDDEVPADQLGDAGNEIEGESELVSPGDDGAIETGNGSQVDSTAEAASEDVLCAELASTGVKNRVAAAAEYYRALGLAKLRKVMPAKLRPSFGAMSNTPTAGACLGMAEDAARQLRTRKSDLERDIASLERKVSDELTADPALRALHGKCVKGTFTQYDFELCAFEHVQQYEHGSVIARLGSWGSWKLGTARPNSVMVYDGGDGCWNGPKRSVTVTLECGAVDEIVSVDEPNRCAYDMLFKTPAVCEESAAEAVLAALTSTENEPKDEL